MRKQSRIAAFAVAAALSLSMAVPAFADTPTVPSVGKTLEMNAGSTVSATFSYTATPKALDAGDGTETYTDGPEAEVADIELTDATSAANNTGTGAITFGGKSDASAFAHAGVYAWTIKESAAATISPSNGEMQYDSQVYTLIATVVNGDNGLEFGSIVVAKGDATSVTNSDKVSGDTIPFVNEYTENTNDQPDNPNPDNPDNPDNPGSAGNTNLVLKKTVAGAQGDKTKQFEFTVTFKAPKILPEGKSAADVLNEINPVVTSGKATITDEGTVTGAATERTITFKAADAQYVTFANILVGTTYDVSETAAAGYAQSYANVSDGVAGSSASDVLVGEKTNTGTMTNTHSDITPTGLIVDNAPFVLLGGVAVAGAVAYGAAKRRLER